ncbi:hypothetical protein C8R43DRAFT_955165 [Mycena crocata]|nr:hypothetical protein C8R43DRAFT_955165 [Mycena crocata]
MSHRVNPAPAPANVFMPVGTTMMCMPMMAFMVVPFPGCMPVSTPISPTEPPASVKSEPATVSLKTPPPMAKVAAPGASLPAPLLALLCSEGPFLANEVYSVAPAAPLEAVEEEETAPEWYALTRGWFVGVIDQYALSDVAISGVGGSVRKVL